MLCEQGTAVNSLSREPLVSILIVNYRAYAELTRCLRSLHQFVESDIEVLVVDHASEFEEISQLKREFSWIRLMEIIDNPGFAAGVNRAARSATGKYLLLMNPDCLVGADVAHTLAAWLDENPQVGACGALVRDEDGGIQASARRFPDLTTAFAGRSAWLTKLWPTNQWTERNLLARNATAPTEVDWVSGACTMIRRNAFESVGGMDEGFFLYWEDADLCFRMRQKDWSIVYHPGVGVTHLTGRSSAHARQESLVAFHRSAFRYFRKHASRKGLTFAPIVYMALQARLFLKLTQLRFGRFRRA
jgi:GT2 family glycosyltransferase